MKKIILTTILALFASIAFAQTNLTVSFNAMRLSEDSGKTWSDPLPVKGTLLFQAQTITLTIVGESQKYTVLSSSTKDDTLTCECKNSDDENIQVTYNEKEKKALIITPASISSLAVTGQTGK
ncbi:MAG: hypothetical protein RSF93_04745 [Mucinivorans sp.]